MTWRHRGIPYQRSTGNWLEVNTVDQQPFSADPLASGTAILIRDNRALGAGDGIYLASRNGSTICGFDAAGAARGSVRVQQTDADGRALITIFSGEGGIAGNDDIEIDTARGGGVRGDIRIHTGNVGAATAAGDLEIICDDLGHVGGNILVQAGVWLSLISNANAVLSGDVGVAAVYCGNGTGDGTVYITGNRVEIEGNNTLPSYFDGYAGGLTLQSTGGVTVLLDLAQTPGAIAPPANFSGTITINGVEVPYY